MQDLGAQSDFLAGVFPVMDASDRLFEAQRRRVEFIESLYFMDALDLRNVEGTADALDRACSEAEAAVLAAMAGPCAPRARAGSELIPPCGTGLACKALWHEVCRRNPVGPAAARP